MKIIVLLVGFIVSATPAEAQTPAVPPQPAPQTAAAAQPPQTVTLSGCVASVNNSPSAFTLSNAAFVPTSAQPGVPTTVPGATPVGTVAPPSPTPAQPPATPPVSIPATPPGT